MTVELSGFFVTVTTAQYGSGKNVISKTDGEPPPTLFEGLTGLIRLLESWLQ